LTFFSSKAIIDGTKKYRTQELQYKIGGAPLKSVIKNRFTEMGDLRMDLIQKAEDNFCLISIVFNVIFLFFAFWVITSDLPISLMLDCSADWLSIIAK